MHEMTYVRVGVNSSCPLPEERSSRVTKMPTPEVGVVRVENKSSFWFGLPALLFYFLGLGVETARSGAGASYRF